MSKVKIKKIVEAAKICTVGATVDGREVNEKNLKDAVANFDKYPVSINSEHYHWSALGSVQNLRFDNGSLIADINPSPELLSLWQQGQKTRFSAELSVTKELGTVLTGLAVTDYPACVGISQVEFTLNDDDDMHLSDGGSTRKSFLLSVAPPVFSPSQKEKSNDEAFKNLQDSFNILQKNNEDLLKKLDETNASFSKVISLLENVEKNIALADEKIINISQALPSVPFVAGVKQNAQHYRLNFSETV